MWKTMLIELGRRFLNAVGRVLLRRAKEKEMAEVAKASGAKKPATKKKVRR